MDYVEPIASEEGQKFIELAKKYLSADEVARINRYTMTGYAGARVLLAAIAKCGKDLTWACTNAELAKTKDLMTGVMAPISFADGSRFSNQKVQIMRADFKTLGFTPVK